MNTNTQTTRLDDFATQTSDLEIQITQMPQAVNDRGFLSTLFHNEEYKKIAEAQLALVTCQIEYRRKALVMYSNLRIEQLRKYCESQAQRGGIEINLETEMHIRELVAKRESWANSAVDKFLENYEAATERMEKIRSPDAKAKEEARLKKTLESFYDTIEYFNEEFKKSLTFQAGQALV